MNGRTNERKSLGRTDFPVVHGVDNVWYSLAGKVRTGRVERRVVGIAVWYRALYDHVRVCRERRHD